MNGTKELCGMIPVFKPEGWTSFDVVAKLRGILHIRRLDKAYEAGFRLGIVTDTQDITGRVLETSERTVSRREIEDALSAFRGEIMQRPPM